MYSEEDDYNVENYQTTVDTLVEITLKAPDDFLKVKETLTRIGVASRLYNELYQSCHILAKYSKTRFFICHFKELLALDGRETDFTTRDVARRNTIVSLLAKWGLVEVVRPEQIESPRMEESQIFVLPYKEKQYWDLVPKYTIGVKHPKQYRNY